MTRLKASEVRSEDYEEVCIPQAMVGDDPPRFADSWTTFYDAYQDGDRMVFDIGEGVTWTCPADQVVKVQ